MTSKSSSQGSHDDSDDQMAASSNKQTGNLWLDLPMELRERILDQADPLTQYLNQRGAFYALYHLDKGSSLERWASGKRHKLAFEFWRAVFRFDWDGDLTSLPFKVLKYQMYPTLVTMWTRLKDTFTLAHWTEKGFGTDRLFCAIAMHHMWHDLVEKSGVATEERAEVTVAYGLMDYTVYLQKEGVPIRESIWSYLMVLLAIWTL
jgi:hypothetical protein